MIDCIGYEHDYLVRFLFLIVTILRFVFLQNIDVLDDGVFSRCVILRVLRVS